ncbi:ADAMTS-like protein 5 [Tachyglossus aculeatus]|uniref:ADAMTS-like protein 5 n=1 Tax=Tachyglossus aculeatus TaxID=9261 RepID=UPI0018F540AE|nr:ADAMTS-like protein 5 [Tachyglossus aculeatus]
MPKAAGSQEARAALPGLGCSRLRICSISPGLPRSLLLLTWLSLCWEGEGRIQGPNPPTLRLNLLALPHSTRQQGPGHWTSWGAWTGCSSTCGDGASVRSRRCIRLPEEDPCNGDSRQYRLCHITACPPGAVPFRELQCALYNARPIPGHQATYQWVPFHGAPNLCDLNCLAEGHTFYYTFGRVLDGTHCGPDTDGLCISGRCLSVGCDGVLGSGAREDHCGTCGGANDSCLFIQRVYREAAPTSGFFGYRNVTRIPTGARHIRVTDQSRNYLALMGSDGRHVINGNWAIDWPGVYEVAGTQVRYIRSAGHHESLEAVGPTGEDLLLQVLFQEANPGIEFEFWLPRALYWSFQGTWGDFSALRQPQTREVEVPSSQDPPPRAWSHTGHESPRRDTQMTPGREVCPLASSFPLTPVPLIPPDSSTSPIPQCLGSMGARTLPSLVGEAAKSRGLELGGVGFSGWVMERRPVLPYIASSPGASLSSLLSLNPSVLLPGTCRACPNPKGHSRRLQHYCQSDFVFRGRVLARRQVGQETRYDVQVQHTYKNLYPLERREYLWAPGVCPCPLLAEQREYLLTARRHVNYEGTLNRLLLPRAGYARPWSPRQDTLIREAAKHCPRSRAG